jgi:hypothetical protein
MLGELISDETRPESQMMMGALWRKVKHIMEGRDDAAVKRSFVSQVEIAD